MTEGLVNILTPAYNSGKYIHRLLDSVLSQTYHDISMIVVDDGSTDNTAEVVRKYFSRFENKGYSLKYIRQENQGQSYAINNGLKRLNGEFLFWPDSDDWYSREDSIEILVKALKKSDDEVGIVRCRYQMMEEQPDGSYIPSFVTDFEGMTESRYLLRDAITRENGFRWEPGGYGIKLKYLDKFIHRREITVGPNLGQNAQIMLPFFAYSKCLSIDEVLFNYLIRPHSHSRGFFKGYNKVVSREMGHMNLISDILMSLTSSTPFDLKELKRINEMAFNLTMFNLAIENNVETDIVSKGNELKTLGYSLSKQEKLIYWFAKYLRQPKLAKRLLKLTRLNRY